LIRKFRRKQVYEKEKIKKKKEKKRKKKKKKFTYMFKEKGGFRCTFRY
jgi:hypothetical protein